MPPFQTAVFHVSTKAGKLAQVIKDKYSSLEDSILIKVRQMTAERNEKPRR